MATSEAVTVQAGAPASTLDQMLLPIMADAEAGMSERAHGVTLAEIERRAEQAIAVVDARVRALAKIRAAAIVSTEPEHWVAFKDKTSQREMAMLTAAGCYALIDLYGIRIFNLRGPDGVPVQEPVIVDESDGSMSAVLIVDAEATFTGKRIEGIRAERNSGEKFIGRAELDGVNPATKKNDLKSAARTLADSKAIRILTFTSKVPVPVLASHFGAEGIKRLVLGSGYGAGDARRAEQTMTPEAKTDLEAFKKAVVGYCGGDEKAALAEMQALAAFKNDKGETVAPKSWEHLAGKVNWFKKTVEKFNAKITREEGGGE